MIRTELKNLRDSLLHFGYTVERAEDGTVLAEGETTHIVVDSNFAKRPLPERYRAAFERAINAK